MDVCYQIEGGGVQRFNRRFGLLPVMVKSEVCYLHALDRWAAMLCGDAAQQCLGAADRIAMSSQPSIKCSWRETKQTGHDQRYRPSREALVKKGQESTDTRGTS